MDNNPQIFHGEWWVPAVADHDTRMNFLQPEGMMGHECKDIQKYKDQIEILLNQFKDVKAIVKCHIKPEVLTDSRNYYSHLFPDEEIKLAVEGDDLYWLTEKCKILLTCCILNLLGLTNKEINLCCENSPINQMMDSFPLEQDPESMLL